MKIMKKNIESVVEGLHQYQVQKFFENLSKQLSFPINISKMKTGIVEGRLLGIDDAGNFIASSGHRLPNGDIATISNFGTCVSGCSKVVPKEDRLSLSDILKSLVKQFKNDKYALNIDRTKTGTIAGKPFCYDDKGNFISVAHQEVLPNGSIGTISSIGKFETAVSKIVPKTALPMFNIKKI